jgi:hypothetical protein
LISCADRSCLERAFGQCRAAHLATAHFTVEGTSAYLDYFVVPSAQGCSVTTLGDFSEDYWGACRIVQRDCPSIAAALSNDPDRAGCGPSRVLEVRSPCELPAGAGR